MAGRDRRVGAVFVERDQRRPASAGCRSTRRPVASPARPRAQGTSSFTVQVTDGQVPFDAATRALSITVLPVSYRAAGHHDDEPAQREAEQELLADACGHRRPGALRVVGRLRAACRRA